MKIIFYLFIICLLYPVNLYAEVSTKEQVLVTKTSTDSSGTNRLIDVVIEYSVTDNDNTTGLGVNIFYDLDDVKSNNFNNPMGEYMDGSTKIKLTKHFKTKYKHLLK